MCQKNIKKRPGWHVKIWGCAFLGRKNRRRPPCPEAQGFFAFLVWDDPHSGQNMVLGLIRPLTAPIGVIIGASGAESRGGADYGIGLAHGRLGSTPQARKEAEGRR